MLKYIGRITIKSLRDCILDNSITDKDTIMLNQYDFDEIVLEYRETYKASITIPYCLLGVLIKEDEEKSTPINRIKIVKNDTKSRRKPFSLEEVSKELKYYNGEVVHRCGWCGNIVDDYGNELHGSERKHKISILEKFRNEVNVQHRHGKCCPNGNK